MLAKAPMNGLAAVLPLAAAVMCVQGLGGSLFLKLFFFSRHEKRGFVFLFVLFLFMAVWFIHQEWALAARSELAWS